MTGSTVAEHAALIAYVVILVLLAGLLTAAEAAIGAFSRARAEELHEEGRAGSARLLTVLEDPKRYLNTAVFLELLCEVAAIVIATLVFNDILDGWWPTLGASVAVMVVVSFVAIGVGPRTLGRQHHERVALWSAWPLVMTTRILGPVPTVLIWIGNALTPGKGFREGPFNTETELREMVDLAEASAMIEAGERKMIQSVFELGDTTAREVMVPRGDVIFIERHKNLRQTLSLFLRSGFSRLPVIDDNLDNVVGFAYLKDIVRRDFEDPEVETTQRVDEVMREPFWVPESKPVDALLTQMQANRQHIAVVVDEYGGTAGIITIEDILEEIVGEITDEYDTEERGPIELEDGSVRVPARYLVDDLEELFGFDVSEDDVDSVGGLMAKHLGVVPIPGATVVAHGLRFTAESAAGRRNKIDTVVITRTDQEDS